MNTIYRVEELNRRERDASDRKAHLYLGGCVVLGIFLIAAAIVGGWS